MDLRVEDIASHLQKIRDDQGEADFQTALQGLLKQLLVEEKNEPFVVLLLQHLNTTVDLEALKAEAASLRTKRQEAQAAAQAVSGGRDLSQVMTEHLKSQMPNLKTQAQFDLVMTAFETLQHYLNAAFAGSPNLAKSRETLDQLLDLAAKIAVLEEKVQELPQAEKHADFVTPPREFTEHDKVKQLLAVLPTLATFEALQQWYRAEKPTMDSIVSLDLRNQLFDAIRSRRNALAN